jgi:phenylpropionate dioxygenase-like ring-hydroxylating dioxygenase large terminal subunit
MFGLYELTVDLLLLFAGAIGCLLLCVVPFVYLREKDVTEHTGHMEQTTEFPVGWYILDDSIHVVDSVPVKRRFAGIDWVVYRTTNQVVVMRAECPHMGADLSQGSVLPSGQIQCPYHGWRFGVDGTCTQSAAPPQQTLLTLEQDQMIFVWWHPQNTGPTWRPDPFGLSGTPCSKQEILVAQSIRTIVENSHDVGHLQYVHGHTYESNVFFSTQWSTDAPSTRENSPHVRTIGSCVTIRPRSWFTWPCLRPVVIHMRVEHHGPAIWYIPIEVDIMGYWTIRLAIVQQQLPLNHTFQTKNVTRVYSPNYLVRRLFLWVTMSEIRSDLRIWQTAGQKTRKHLWAPLACGVVSKHDKLLQGFRTWYNQFRPPSSSQLEW